MLCNICGMIIFATVDFYMQ